MAHKIMDKGAPVSWYVIFIMVVLSAVFPQGTLRVPLGRGSSVSSSPSRVCQPARFPEERSEVNEAEEPPDPNTFKHSRSVSSAISNVVGLLPSLPSVSPSSTGRLYSYSSKKEFRM